MQISPSLAAILGTVVGAAYFAHSESSVPATSNCSYLAPWTTDLAAWIAGAVLLHRGWSLSDSIISFIGSLIITIHVGQFAAHKVIVNRITRSKIKDQNKFGSVKACINFASTPRKHYLKN